MSTHLLQSRLADLTRTKRSMRRRGPADAFGPDLREIR